MSYTGCHILRLVGEDISYKTDEQEPVGVDHVYLDEVDECSTERPYPILITFSGIEPLGMNMSKAAARKLAEFILANVND